MLVLQRKIGEAVYVGPYLVVLDDGGRDWVQFRFEYGFEVHVKRIWVGDEVVTPAKDRVRPLERVGDRYKLGFIGPGRVVREEIAKHEDIKYAKGKSEGRAAGPPDGTAVEGSGG